MKKKTVDAGSLISSAYAEQLIAGYELFTNADSPTFTIKRELIHELLSLNHVTGLRFMYGLREEFNVSSAEIIIVPCTSYGDFGVSKPLASKHEYFNHLGERISIQDTAAAVRNFVNYIQLLDKTWKYQEVTRGTFFGVNSLESLLNKEGCVELKISLGFGTQEDETRPHIHPVLEAQNIHHENSWLEILEFGTGCPPRCVFDLTDMMGTISNEVQSEELNELFMNFRNEELLNSENGKATYELYYFVTPLVNSILQERSIKVQSFYAERFKPAMELIRKESEMEGINMINSTLESLIEEFHHELV